MDIAEFLALSSANQIITLVEFFLIALFLLFSLRLIISWFIDRSRIRKLYKLLFKYKKNIQMSSQGTELDISHKYDELLNEINSLGANLQKTWKFFDESLFKNKFEDRIIIRRYKEADFFFNKMTMVKNFDSKIFKSTADKLLIIGIVGSMIAIYFVLSNLDTSSVLKLQGALRGINDVLILLFSNLHLDESAIIKLMDSFTLLVKVVGVKLWVAILAINLAVIFSYKHKFLENILEKNLAKVQLLVDEIFVKKYNIRNDL